MTAIKHIVSRHMYEFYAMTLGHLSQIGGSLMIKFIAQLHFLLSLIHIGIGRTVDDAAYIKCAHHAIYSIDIADIKLCYTLMSNASYHDWMLRNVAFTRLRPSE